MGDTTVFDRGTAIEILHRLERPTTLSYTVELPGDLRLQPTLDPTAVEVVDAAGVARMRLTADAAWDRAGARVPVRLSVAGARVAIEVPASVAWPVVIDPAWSATTLPARLRTGQTATMMGDGNVLVAGGGNASAEIFDTRTARFSLVGSMSAARTNHSATLLPDGRVWIAGGSGSTTELYDPTTRTFSAGPSMATVSGATKAVRLGDGTVLVAGGSKAERFDPVTNTLTTLSKKTVATTPVALTSGNVLFVGPSNAAELYRAATADFVALTPGVPGLAEFGVPTTDGNAVVFDAMGASALGDASDSFTAPFARVEARLVPTVAGGLLVVGGTMNAGAVAGSSARDTATLSPPGWSLRPTITKAPTTIVPGAPFDVEGTRFTDVGRAPSFTFVPAAGVGSVFVTTASFTGTTAKLVLPATAFRGKGFLHASVGGVISAGLLVDVGAAANGAACTEGASCGSGFCVDGVCCDTKCEGVCFACSKARKGSGADGTCGAIPPEKDPKDACASFQGAPCTSDAQCATGICADGVCCDARCDGQCEACSVEGSVGTCVPVVGDPKGTRGKCDAGTDACNARRCDGKNRKACDGFSPSITSCRMGSCAAGVETLAASCTGDGACPAAVTKSCEPFACGEGACLTRCTADTECATNYRCSAGKCVTGPYCADTRTLKTPGAADKDCAPYACEGDKCKTTCGSSLECAGGFVCTGGECVAAPSGASTDDGGGCSTTTRGGASWLALLLLVGLARRRA